MNYYCIRLFLFAAIGGLLITTAHASDIKPVKYVFLFIGDGLSLPQRMIAEEYLRKTENRGLQINAMESLATTTTTAADAFITDSAASGTAIACGEKTNVGCIGVAPDGVRRLTSVAEVARDHGRKVGIVTTVPINDATPAAFYAHNGNRANAYEIGLDLIASGFDYFGGGGINRYNDKTVKQYRGDLYELAKKAGYTVARNSKEFRELKPGKGKYISVGRIDWAIPFAIDTPKGEPRLADFTRQCIEFIDHPGGFFIMVEGGAIDWMCHANDAATVIREIIDFDDAVSVAIDFAAEHPSDTLIVVTGDHETGGLSLGFAGTGYCSYIELLSRQTMSTDELADQIRKIGNVSDRLSFDDVKPLISKGSGLLFPGDPGWKSGGTSLTESEERELRSLFENSLEYGKLVHGTVLARAAVRLVNAKASIGWSSNAHTALPSITTSQGPGSRYFINSLDNTDIGKRLKETVK